MRKKITIHGKNLSTHGLATSLLIVLAAAGIAVIGFTGGEVDINLSIGQGEAPSTGGETAPGSANSSCGDVNSSELNATGNVSYHDRACWLLEKNNTSMNTSGVNGS